jgi:hypothetical protein
MKKPILVMNKCFEESRDKGPLRKKEASYEIRSLSDLHSYQLARAECAREEEI